MAQQLALHRRIRQSSRWLVVTCALAVLSGWGRSAAASSPDVHRWLTERALRGVCESRMMIPPTEEQLVKFYVWLGHALATSADETKADPDQQRFVDGVCHQQQATTHPLPPQVA